MYDDTGKNSLLCMLINKNLKRENKLLQLRQPFNGLQSNKKTSYQGYFPYHLSKG